MKMVSNYYSLLKALISGVIWLLCLMLIVSIDINLALYFVIVFTPLWIGFTGYGAILDYRKEYDCKCDVMENVEHC